VQGKLIHTFLLKGKPLVSPQELFKILFEKGKVFDADY
jgi:hypothetical protein